MENKIIASNQLLKKISLIIAQQLKVSKLSEFSFIKQLVLADSSTILIFSSTAYSKSKQQNPYFVATGVDGQIIIGCYLDIIKNNALVKDYIEDRASLEVPKPLRGQGIHSAVFAEIRRYANLHQLTLVIEEVRNERLAKRLISEGFKKELDPSSLFMPEMQPIYNYVAPPQ